MSKMSATSFLAVIFLAFSLQAQDSTFTPHYKFKPGKEIVAVYVGSSHCGPCKTPDFKKNLQKMLLRISNETRKSGDNFWTLGISVDADISAGYEFLKSTGRFDEISIGKSWKNSAILRYILPDEYSTPATPQIVILERQAARDGVGKVPNEKILLRLSGNGELKKWLAGNIPLAEAKTFKGMLIDEH